MTDRPLSKPGDILASLIGEWLGHGVVSLPSMRPRSYEEQVRFARRSEGSLDYWQRAVAPEDGSLLHSESGIWRLAGEGIEISVALPGGSEVSEGSLTGRAIVLASTALGRASTGAPLAATARRYELEGDSISYEIDIATDRAPTFGHLRGRLDRRGHRVRPAAPTGP